MTTDEIKREAMRLPEDQRLSLAHELLSSIEPEVKQEIAKAWDAEIRKRISRYDDGRTGAIPVSEVFKELEARLKR